MENLNQIKTLFIDEQTNQPQITAWNGTYNIIRMEMVEGSKIKPHEVSMAVWNYIDIDNYMEMFEEEANEIGISDEEFEGYVEDRYVDVMESVLEQLSEEFDIEISTSKEWNKVDYDITNDVAKMFWNCRNKEEVMNELMLVSKDKPLPYAMYFTLPLASSKLEKTEDNVLMYKPAFGKTFRLDLYGTLVETEIETLYVENNESLTATEIMNRTINIGLGWSKIND